MRSIKKEALILLSVLLAGGVFSLTGCGGSSSDSIGFSYDESIYEPTYGDKTNDESHLYNNVSVNPVTNALRSDFAYGVDVSMIKTVEDCGGIFYNKDGKQQDVFQILKSDGVNFVRFRLWNDPADKYGRSYGGGANTADVDLALAKRAKAVGLNVCLDFHYSDFWADPDNQVIPKAWQALEKDVIPSTLKSFTVDTLKTFKDAGVIVDAVQIGNEINNGMMSSPKSYGAIDWDNLSTSFDYIAELIKNGIAGAKEVFPNAQTIVHLANGGNADEFATDFKLLDEKGVDYDIIGASFYPYLSGSLSKLQKCLDDVTALTGKPAMVMETSWGYTDETSDNAANQYYGPDDEDIGGYLTSEQAQATSLRDVCDVLSKVPNSLGLGCFYWEPTWLPLSGAGWATKYGQGYVDYGDDKHSSNYTDGLATWCNQGWFSYTGKELSSAATYRYIKEGGKNQLEEKSTKVRSETQDVVINIAANETLPVTITCETNLDGIRSYDVVWESGAADKVKAKGTYEGIKGVVDGKYDVTLNAKCIENFIVDPSFENQGETDVIKDPWSVISKTPSTDKVAKLDRKSDTRTGSTDLNWYDGSNDFTFDVAQTIFLKKGTYTLTTYIKAEAQATAETKALKIYVKEKGSASDIANFDLVAEGKVLGWASGYQECTISDIVIDSDKDVQVGLNASCAAKAWGHNDDWSLVSVD